MSETTDQTFDQPTDQPTLRFRCQYIYSRGGNKGNMCGVAALSEVGCAKHKLIKHNSKCLKQGCERYSRKDYCHIHNQVEYFSNWYTKHGTSYNDKRRLAKQTNLDLSKYQLDKE